ncbi:MAG: hypothetical protein ACPG9P_05780, partial [Candidatus Pseudothioglobus sp.]
SEYSVFPCILGLTMIGYYVIQTMFLWWVLCGQCKYVMNLRNIVLDYSDVYHFVTTTEILVSSETCNLRQAYAKEPVSAYWACSAEAAKAAFFCDQHIITEKL